MASVLGSKDYELLQLILAVVDYDRPNLRQPPSLSYLAFLAGLPVSTFRERLRELTNLELADSLGLEEVLEIRLSGLKKKIASEANKEKRSEEEGAF